MDDSNSRLVLHLKYNFAYITLILLVALLVVIAHKWTPQPRFTEYLSNAATLASLLLALVAIVYSFVSSESISKSLGQISLISRDVQASKDEVREFVGTAKGLNSKAEESLHQYQQISEQVGGELISLNRAILSLDSHTKSLQETVGDIPSRLSQIEDKFGGLEKAVNNKYAQDENQPTSPTLAVNEHLFSSDSIDKFLERSSLHENLLAIAIVLAYKTSSLFSIEDFCSAVKLNVRNKTAGFISCMNAVGLASLTKSESPRVYSVNHVDKMVMAKAVDYLNEYLDFVKHIDPNQHSEFTAKLASVNDLYKVNTES